MKPIAKLARLCKLWGGELKLVGEAKFNALFNRSEGSFITYEVRERHRALGFYASPASNGHGLHWPTKTVYAVRELANAGAIIHEMGHVFLDEDSPTLSEEFDWLGWEIALARQVGCYRIWDEQNAHYGIGDVKIIPSYYEWGDLPRKYKQRLARNRIREGRRAGIIDRNGRPRPRPSHDK